MCVILLQTKKEQIVSVCSGEVEEDGDGGESIENGGWVEWGGAGVEKRGWGRTRGDLVMGGKRQRKGGGHEERR